MEQYLFNLSQPVEDLGEARVQPNLWLLTGEEMPPLLFSPEEVSRILHVGRGKVYDLLRGGELRSVKVGGSRRISARALARLRRHPGRGRARVSPAKAANGCGSVFKRTDGRWCAALYVTEADGRRVRRRSTARVGRR